MMRITEASVDNKFFVLFAAALLAAAGIVSYQRLGKLEDPEFTVKRALVITPYPGASAFQVEQEVTDRIEIAVQELHELDQARSLSRPGLSVVYVDIKEKYWGEELPQIWDKLRRLINDVQPRMPPEAMRSMVEDDFGNVFGILLAVKGDGFSRAELRDYADELRRELLLVEDVARIDLWGALQECIYLEIKQARLAERNIPPALIFQTMTEQNMVVNAGHAETDRERVRLQVKGEFAAAEDIEDLLIRGLPGDRLVRIGDIATVKRGYQEPPDTLMRFNGEPAVGLAVAASQRGDLITMGEVLRERLDQLLKELPAGLEVETVSYQPTTVREAIDEFTRNLALAVSIVLTLLLIFMGFRSGILIGGSLLLTILVTFSIMRVLSIELHRVSLGALIIALGMLVDNAVVVIEGSLVRLQRGEGRRSAVVRTVQETAVSLLAATAVAALAFMPVFLAHDDVGEYTRSLFQVVGISLAVSWLIAVTLIPAGCHLFLKVKDKNMQQDPYAGRIYRKYRLLLHAIIRRRFIAASCVIGLLLLALLGFRFVENMFFPESTRPQLMIDYWLPEGSRIETVSEDLRDLEDFVLNQPETTAVASFIGAGPPRFYLPMEPQFPNPAFGQLIVNLEDARHLTELQDRFRQYLRDNYPHAEPRVRLFPLGPVTDFKVEARFSGPEPTELRRLSRKARDIMHRDPQAKEIRDDWRQPVKTLELDYLQSRGRWTNVSRPDVAEALKSTFDGKTVGLYRENDKMLPIILRPPAGERRRTEHIGTIQVRPELSPFNFTLLQAINKIEFGWEEANIKRQDRGRTITAQCDPADGDADSLLRRIKPEIEAIPLPPGYSLEWGGEYESANEARVNLLAGLPLTGALMILIIVGLFNSLRKPLLVFSLLPLAMIGITAGLLMLRVPFGFLALVGGLSLAGMLIKNSVVLIEQIDLELAGGKQAVQAVLDASVSRLRPVMMASMTTVMGMLPLLFDRFWTSMGVTIVFGLSFATLLTLLILPTLYTILFRISSE